MFVQVLSLALLATAQAVSVLSDFGHGKSAPISYNILSPTKQIVSQPVYSQPIYQKAIAAPAYTQVVHSAPVIQKSIAYQAPQIVHAAPQIVHAAPQYVQAAPQIVHAAPQYVQAAPQILHAAPQYVQAAPQVVHAAPQYVQAPVYQKQIIPQVVTKVVEPEPIDPNPKYSFSYGVSDPHTGDYKNAEEHLEDGVIHGSYSLVEPDGHVRKVTYTADHVNGFNAVVERTGGAKVVAAAPVAKYISAPVTKVFQAAPLGGHPW